MRGRGVAHDTTHAALERGTDVLTRKSFIMETVTFSGQSVHFQTSARGLAGLESSPSRSKNRSNQPMGVRQLGVTSAGFATDTG